MEDDLETSSRVFHLVWRGMLRGTLCLPTEGTGAVPRLPAGAVHLDTPVARLTDDGVKAAALLPGLEMPEYRTVTTYYHTAPRSPLAEPVLGTDVRRRFLNTCVLSEVVPESAGRQCGAGGAVVAVLHRTGGSEHVAGREDTQGGQVPAAGEPSRTQVAEPEGGSGH
ncbi:hypothetical protein ACFWB6_09780 [Streptomyces mirabilis]|uniref:hypothetical protein n=1 Tax=Streptomyces mirabilis TaxID=68239 RepID=UPI00368F3C59